ncbi:hypothetical protein C8F01DRAFT_938333, partial [Mycena amicta]
EECLIDFAELVGDHSGAAIATTVWKCLTEYGIEGRASITFPGPIIGFVMDNATNNDTMVEAIERKCIAAGIYFDAKKSRMLCMPHTVHLA